MVDQNNSQPPNPDPPRTYRGGRRGMFVITLLAVALLAGLAGNMLSTAFGQGFGWQHFGMRDGMFGGSLSPAQIDDRIDRMTKHMAIELDATTDQQAKLASIAKAAAGDLRALREKAQAARAQAVALLTAPTIDRSAIERLRAEQIGARGNGEQTHRAGARRRCRGAQPRAAPEGRGLDRRPGPWARWHRG